MSRPDCRRQFDGHRQSADREARDFKDPYIVLETLRGIYVGLDHEERELANQSIADWVVSADGGVRYDALVLIEEFRITSALPALYELAARLAVDASPGAPYELEKVRRKIDLLSEVR